MLYLVKQNKTYHLRIKVPPNLIRIIGRHEMRFTLKERRKRSATKKVNSVKRKVHILFDKIRLKELEILSMLAKGELTKEEINKIVRVYVDDIIDFFEKEQATGKQRDLEPIIWHQTFEPSSLDAVDWELHTSQ